MLRPSGSRADGDHVRAEAAEQLRRQPVRRAVAAIEHDANAVEAAVDDGQQVVEVLPVESLIDRELRRASA